jgi:hypothetical protein
LCKKLFHGCVVLELDEGRRENVTGILKNLMGQRAEPQNRGIRRIDFRRVFRASSFLLTGRLLLREN